MASENIEDISNAIHPLRLQELCITVIAKNLDSTICTTDSENTLRFRQDIKLPHAITERLLQFLIHSMKLDTFQNESQNKKLVNYLRIFSDAKHCSLRRIALRNAPISDDVVQVLCDICVSHQITDVSLDFCSDRLTEDNDDTPPRNHTVLLPGLLMLLSGDTLVSLSLQDTMLPNSLNQIYRYTQRKAKQNIVFQSKCKCSHIPLCLSAENAPVLATLDASQSFLGWFLTLDPENPPPLKTLVYDGYKDVIVDSMMIEIMEEIINAEVPLSEEEQKPSDQSTVQYSTSATKLHKYDFFKYIDSPEPMLSKFMESSRMRTTIPVLAKAKDNPELDPDHNLLLQQINLSSLKSTLQSLSLFATWLSQSDMETIFSLKNLQHLDLGWCSRRETIAPKHRPKGYDLWSFLDNFSNLKSLDLSRTAYGENLFEKAKIENSVTDRRSVQIMREFEKPPLEFLGLWGTKACRLEGLEKIATTISGDRTEAQLISAIERYINRPLVITESLLKLSSIQQDLVPSLPHRSIQICLLCVARYPGYSRVLMNCALNIYTLTQLDSSFLSIKENRDIVDTLVCVLEKNWSDSVLIYRVMITFFNFDLPTVFLHDFDHIAMCFLDLFDKQRDNQEVSYIAGNLCNALVCSMDLSKKVPVEHLPFVSTMLDVIRGRLSRLVADDTLETAWSALWNVSDESPVNSEDVIKQGALELFLECLEKFPSSGDLHRNMMGTIGNLAEVIFLHPFIGEEKVVKGIVSLVRSKDSGIEVAYHACGILAHLLTDGQEHVKHPDLDIIRKDMREVILSWDNDVQRTVNYRSFEPLLVLLKYPGEQVAHLWVAWAINNLCTIDPNYIKIFIEDGGISLFKELNERTQGEEVGKLATSVLKICSRVEHDM